MLKAISEFEADIAAIADKLRALSINGIVTYEQIDQAIGRPVRAQRFLLTAARDRVEREDGALFATVFKVGLKRLPVESYATVGQHARGTIRRKAGRASKRMQNGIEKANDVPAEILRAVSREQSVLGLIKFAARDKTMAKMLADEPLSAPTPLAKAAKDLMKALGVSLPEE